MSSGQILANHSSGDSGSHTGLQLRTSVESGRKAFWEEPRLSPRRLGPVLAAAGLASVGLSVAGLV